MTKKLAFVLAAGLAGCTSSGSGDVRYSGATAADTPDLVAIDDGVQVVAGADEPMFYTDNSYWLYRNHGWYRSDRYRGSAWTPVDAPPQRLQRITEPMAYVHYKHERGTQTSFNQTTDRVPSPRQEPGYPPRDRDLPQQQDPGQNPAPLPQQPYANPRPPQQEPPAMPDGTGTTDDRGDQNRDVDHLHMR